MNKIFLTQLKIFVFPSGFSETFLKVWIAPSLSDARTCSHPTRVPSPPPLRLRPFAPVDHNHMPLIHDRSLLCRAMAATDKIHHDSRAGTAPPMPSSPFRPRANLTITPLLSAMGEGVGVGRDLRGLGPHHGVPLHRPLQDRLLQDDFRREAHLVLSPPCQSQDLLAFLRYCTGQYRTIIAQLHRDSIIIVAPCPSR